MHNEIKNELSRDFSLPDLLKFTFPTVAMLIFVATYTIIDGMFVSRYVEEGTRALSAINIVFPLINVITGIGIMLGTGGSAIIGRRMGEGRNEDARSNFSLIIVFGVMISILLSAISLIFIEPLSRFLGADDLLLPYCMDYARILIAFYPISVVQIIFQTFFVTAGKPKLGLGLNLLSGLANIFFDYLFIVVFDMGIAGAAWGTVCSFVIGGIPPLFYFAKPRGILYFVKPKWDGSVIGQTLINGSSEMVTSSAMAITTFLFNITMMRMMGEIGVAAITIILYAQFLFSSAYMGFSNGVAPIFSYTYGSRNSTRMRKLFRMCLGTILVSSIVMLGVSYLCAVPTIAFFTPTDATTYNLTLEGYHIFAWNFLFAGINIFASSFFTALSNGLISALLSFLRTFVLVTSCILILPQVWGLNGIWLAIPVAEGLTVILATILLYLFRNKYQYAKPKQAA